MSFKRTQLMWMKEDLNQIASQKQVFLFNTKLMALMKSFLILKPKAKHLPSIFNKQGKYKGKDDCRGRTTCELPAPALPGSTAAPGCGHLLPQEPAQVTRSSARAPI